MADPINTFLNLPGGKQFAKAIGVPVPTSLRRFTPGDAVANGPVLFGSSAGSVVSQAVEVACKELGVDVVAQAGDDPLGAAILDASAITSTEGLAELPEFFAPVMRQLAPSGRVIVLGRRPSDLEDPRAATAQRALEGFVRSVAKELRAGASAQLIEVADGGEAGLLAPLGFLLSGRSAYVSGQVIRVGEPVGNVVIPSLDKPLDGKVALVTGAARGIGAAIADVLARDGATVIGLDIPAAGEALAKTMNRVGGEAFQLDITAERAPITLADHLIERHGGVDIVVHNAGITRDKLLANMDDARWNSVIDVNISSQERIDDVLLERNVIRAGGRIVGVASISGIAGNRGQTNYGTSKAAVIGRVQSMAPILRDKDITINAVAPGFIETEMTAKIPIATREVGRRMNAMQQGGLPVDVAEAIAFFASPASSAVTGNVVRVCGQSLLGA